MNFIKTKIPDLIVVEPDIFQDERGYFFESYNAEKYKEGGIPQAFVQDNMSCSTKGILRGLHAQLQSPQGKLIRIDEGMILDVAVDIRRGSPTFCQWVAVKLDSEKHQQLWIPEGFAHGFFVLSEKAILEYKCTAFYNPGDELTIAWNDPTINIEWPSDNPLLSEKDAQGLSINDVMDKLPIYKE